MALACWSLPAVAGIGFQPVSPDELKIKSEPLAAGASAIILFRQVDRDDNGNTSHEDNYFRIKILTEEGRKYADIEIPFFTASGKIVNLHARTIRPDGSIVHFDGKVFEKTIVKAKGLKYLAKTFTLPDVEVGGIIEYFYTVDLSEHYIYDSHWILSNELFTKNARFSLKPYTSNYIPVGVRWSWQGLPANAAPPKQDPQGIVRLEASNIGAFQTEDFMPPENELKSRVDFVYSEDHFETDSEKFWKNKGKKLNGQLESFVGKKKAMEQAVEPLLSPNDSPETKLRKIYARVQEVRNTSYERRKTEQEEKREKEKQALNVEDVWKRGYGDGVQLTWLYLALVRAAGFEAYGVWTSARNEYFFNPTTMDSTRLNANVVLVKYEGKELYADPGAAFTPFGLLPWMETGVMGLRMDKDGGSWVKTSLPDSSESKIERKAALKLTENGSLEGKLTVTYSGLEALRRRSDERDEDTTARKKFLEDEVREYVPVAIDVELTNSPEWSGSAPTLVAEFEFKADGWVSGAGHRALLPVGLFSVSEKHLFDHEQRVHPIYFQYPLQKVDDITIELPLGWRVTSLPKAQKQGEHPVGYVLKADSDAGKLHLSRTLNVEILLIENKYYPALRNFFQIVRTGDEEQVVLQPAGSVANN
jgi:hypothetical protein